ncbi:MAG: mandelate racemase/muconate lactonizing enzyme family protein [Planctomycetota bacterium]|nr:mandelate racemase/muconate lactonizing enzyme family protein [Planctomycetota bacterium]
MKITNVRAVQPETPTSPPDWRTSLGQFLVAIDTDCGLTGYGVGGGGLAGVHVVRTVLRELLLGESAENVKALWTKMYDSTLAYGRKGLVIMAISGVDLALWDLRGKAANLPVARVLGGNIGEPIPTYTTLWSDITPEMVAEHDAFKLHVEHRTDGDRLAAVVAAVRSARETIGPDRKLMIDAWMRWSLDFTLAVADAIEPFGVDWIEEPLPPDDVRGYEELSARCPIAIAGGEHEFTAAGFELIVSRRLHTILQPDVCWCGGLTELVKIYDLAKQAGLQVCPHRGAEIWGLHAVAALDPTPLAESGRPWMSFVGGQPEITRGKITLTDKPGFGAVIDEALFEGCS